MATAGLKQGVGGMLLSPACSKSPLTRPLPTKDGVVLRTVRDARDYMLALPEGSWRREQWQIAAKFILEERHVATISLQVELALFYEAKLDIMAVDAD
jgi:hypothetical protein